MNTIKALTEIVGFTLGNFNVNVTMECGSAYHSKNEKGEHTINIPPGDLSDPLYMKLSKGFIYHEIGHGVFSCYNTLKKTVDSDPSFSRKKGIANAFEDIWMERAIIKRSKGAAIRLHEMISACRDAGIFSDAKAGNAFGALHNLVLLRGRTQVLGNDLNDLAEQAEEELKSFVGKKLTDKASSIIDEAHHLKSTADAIDLTNKLFQLFEDVAEEEKSSSNDSGESSDSDSSGEDDDSGESSGSDSSGEGDDSSESSDSSDDGDDSGESSDSNSSGEGDDSSESSGSDSSDDGDDSGESSGSSDEGGSSGEDSYAKAIEEIVTGNANEALPDDLHDGIAEKLNELSRKALIEGVACKPMPIVFARKSCPLEIDNLVRRNTQGIYSALKSVLVGRERAIDLYTTNGRSIHNRRLAGTQSGNFSVFQRKGVAKSTKAAVSILVDESSSMIEQMEAVNGVAYAFTSGLKKTGLAVEASYFSSGVLNVAKPFEDNAVDPQRFNRTVRGTTDTASALLSAAMRLATQDVDNKIMFIVTDGMPDNPAALRAAIRDALELGIKIVPILFGLAESDALGFEDIEVIEVSADAQNLLEALRQAVKSRIFN